jgi:putative tricarboxylic transport membrane protein
LGLALAASCFGQAVVYLLLLVLAGPIGALALKLGPPEMLVLSLWGVTLIGTLSGRHLSRGLLAGAFGLLLGTVGLSARGVPRGTFGSTLLLDGIPLVPAIVGLFAAAELFNLVGRDYIVDDNTQRRVQVTCILAGMREAFRHPWVMLRGALLGSCVGIIPGGHAIANLLSYSVARRAAKDPEKFGTGDPRGIVAAESANSSSEGGSMATLLALGIPTGGATAVMLVAFSMQNITGGPSFMRDHADIVYAVVLSNLAQVGVLALVGIAFTFVAGFVVKVRLRMLVPAILSLAVIGSFALAHDVAGPITLAVFAVIGWLMHKAEYPVQAAVVGLLLGRGTEGALLRTYQMSGGHISFMLTRPIAMVMLILLVASTILPRFKSARLVVTKEEVLAK